LPSQAWHLKQTLNHSRGLNKITTQRDISDITSSTSQPCQAENEVWWEAGPQPVPARSLQGASLARLKAQWVKEVQAVCPAPTGILDNPNMTLEYAESSEALKHRAVNRLEKLIFPKFSQVATTVAIGAVNW
jgi:hypothetical protein